MNDRFGIRLNLQNGVQVRELRAEMKQMRALNERLRSLAESVRQISGCPDEVYAILDEALEHVHRELLALLRIEAAHHRAEAQTWDRLHRVRMQEGSNHREELLLRAIGQSKA